MSSEQQAFNDGFDKGYAKASEKIAQLEARANKWIGIAHNIADRNGELEESLREERSEVAQLEDALDTIANDHQTQASFAAREDWHGLFNWAQDIAKTALGGERD